MIRNQVPDSDGKTVPPDTMFGSYELRDLDHPVLGLLYGGKLIVDKTFGHASYGCEYCCAYRYAQLAPTSFSGPPGIDNGDIYQAYDVCNSTMDDFGVAYDWKSSNTAVATLPNSTLHTVAAGTATGSAQNTLPLQSRYCPNENMVAQQAVTVTPRISGPNTVWWFNGQTPSGYSTSITLTASGGSAYSWSITSGSNMITLSGTTGPSVTVKSTGTAFSSTATNIAVTVTDTATGESSAPFYITSRRPYLLVVGTVTDQCDSTWGYDDYFNYTIKDQMGAALPSSIPLNEYWITAVVNDYPNTNWRRSNPGNYTTAATSPAQFADEIQGENITLPPTPPTACPSAGQAVDHWGQEWFIGSLTSGSGASVQTDTIQKYTNNAQIQSITSPVP
ncbi:MAG: hypothetical protein WB660_14170 [Candidatus Sulfotelmatobacter sp.]